MAGGFSFRSAVLGGVIAALVVSAAPVVASVGDAVLAGKTTSAGKQTQLKGSVSSQNLKITNSHPDGSAARFVVQSGNAPFAVNSDTKVSNLNADRLDGLSSGGFLKKSAYDSNKDGVVDSAAVVIRYAQDDFTIDMAAPVASAVQCVTDSVTVAETTTVVAAGGLSLSPLLDSPATIWGFVVYSDDGGTTWAVLNGAGLEDNPGAAGGEAAIPLNAVNALPAGSYTFALWPNGLDLQAGSDYTGYCELSAVAYTGLGASNDVIADSSTVSNLEAADRHR